MSLSECHHIIESKLAPVGGALSVAVIEVIVWSDCLLDKLLKGFVCSFTHNLDQEILV